jgi:hypothetical protein
MPWHRVCLIIAVMAAFVMGHPLPGPAGEESWQAFHREIGGAVYAYCPASIVQTGDGIEVRVRAVELSATEAGLVTTIRYRLDCRQRTFRILDVVEERENLRSVCTTVSDDIPIQARKHRHVEALHAELCF